MAKSAAQVTQFREEYKLCRSGLFAGFHPLGLWLHVWSPLGAGHFPGDAQV